MIESLKLLGWSILLTLLMVAVAIALHGSQIGGQVCR
jgi:hypothetical protein